MKKVSKPLVSVVIACYNHQSFVQDCIESVIKQTYENVELIIIDDGSVDDSVDKIKEMISLCENRFVNFEFRYRENRGLTATLNEALMWCSGEYYCPFASDDIMKKNRLTLQVNYLENNIDCAGVFGAYEVIDNNGLVVGVRSKKNKKYQFEDIFLHKHELPAPTQLLRMSVVKNMGGYIDNILIEDWYMWLKISNSGYSLDYINFLFVQYRKHHSNTSNKLDLVFMGRLDIINMFKDSIFYNEAYAHAFLVSANEYLAIGDNRSWSMYLQFVKRKGGFFTIKSFQYLLKFIIRIVR